jgi:hypothetical protein
MKETAEQTYLKALSRRARDLYHELSTVNSEIGLQLKPKAAEAFKKAVLNQIDVLQSLDNALGWEITDVKDH